MISDAHTPVREVGDDEPEGTSGDVEIGQDGDNLVMRHPVEGFAEVYSGCNHSSRALGGVVEVLENEVNHSYDVVNN